MPEDLAPEIKEFERLQDDLKAHFGPDEWIVISEGALQGHFSRFEEAAMFAESRFKDRPALVRQVNSPPIQAPYVLMRA